MKGRTVINEEVEARVYALLENSLPYLDDEYFNSIEEQRWILICFAVGAVIGSPQLETEADAIEIATRAICKLFKWPRQGTATLVTQAYSELEAGNNLGYYAAGKTSIEQFEASVRRLAELCESMRTEN